MSQATVVERKHAFLRQQKQILSRDIAPSHRLLDIVEEAGIQGKVFADVMMKGESEMMPSSNIHLHALFGH